MYVRELRQLLSWPGLILFVFNEWMYLRLRQSISWPRKYFISVLKDITPAAPLNWLTGFYFIPCFLNGFTSGCASDVAVTCTGACICSWCCACRKWSGGCASAGAAGDARLPLFSCCDNKPRLIQLLFFLTNQCGERLLSALQRYPWTWHLDS